MKRLCANSNERSFNNLDFSKANYDLLSDALNDIEWDDLQSNSAGITPYYNIFHETVAFHHERPLKKALNYHRFKHHNDS